jgi:hypothetical protein
MSDQQVSTSNRNGPLTAVPDPEVRPKAHRYQITAEYKALILSEADAGVPSIMEPLFALQCLM